MDKKAEQKFTLKPELRQAIREKTASVHKRHAEYWAKQAQVEEFYKEASEYVKKMSDEDKARYIPDYAYGKGHAAGFEEGKLAGAQEAAPFYIKYMKAKVAEVLGEEAAGQLDEHMGNEEEMVNYLVEVATDDAIKEIVDDITAQEGEEAAEQIIKDPATAEQILAAATERGNQAVAELLEEEEIGPEDAAPAEEPPAEPPMY